MQLLNYLFVKRVYFRKITSQYLKMCLKKQVKLIVIQIGMLPKTWYYSRQPQTDHYGKFFITYQASST